MAKKDLFEFTKEMSVNTETVINKGFRVRKNANLIKQLNVLSDNDELGDNFDSIGTYLELSTHN